MNFKRLFEPKTMAVVGISFHNDRNPANVVFNKNNHRYPVKVFPVNPRGGAYQGEKVYSRISEIPEKIDLAVIAVRAENVPDIITECIEAGVGGAVVVSGGFAEIGRKDLQDRAAAIAREAAFPFIGPNCIGVINPNYCGVFTAPIPKLNSKGCDFVSGSGATAVFILE